MDIKLGIDLRTKLLGIFLAAVLLSIGFDTIVSFLLYTFFHFPGKGRMPLGNISLPVFLVLFYLFTYGKMKEIITLSKGLKTVSSGNLDYRAKVRGSDELSELASSINSMVERLQESFLRERELESSKSELVTSLSHDLRTPLTSILGYLKLIRGEEAGLDPVTLSYLDIAYRNTEKLGVLVDDLFLYAKSSYGSLILKKESFDLKDLIVQLVSETGGIAEDKGVSLEIGGMDGGSILFADPVHLHRVFENILANAVKYSTKPGKVTVGMKGQNDRATVTVTNHGDPIEAGDLDRIFERNYRIPDSSGQNTEGSGLGLAISRNIVLQHDGRIWASCEGNRITVSVELPLSAENPDQRKMSK